MEPESGVQCCQVRRGFLSGTVPGVVCTWCVFPSEMQHNQTRRRLRMRLGLDTIRGGSVRGENSAGRGHVCLYS